MMIYAQIPEKYIRLQICRQKEQSQYLTIVDTTSKEVENMCKKVIESQNLSIFETVRKTSINIREAVGGQNGKQTSISFRGLSAKQTMDLIVDYINKNNSVAAARKLPVAYTLLNDCLALANKTIVPPSGTLADMKKYLPDQMKLAQSIIERINYVLKSAKL